MGRAPESLMLHKDLLVVRPCSGEELRLFCSPHCLPGMKVPAEEVGCPLSSQLCPSGTLTHHTQALSYMPKLLHISEEHLQTLTPTIHTPPGDSLARHTHTSPAKQTGTPPALVRPFLTTEHSHSLTQRGFHHITHIFLTVLLFSSKLPCSQLQNCTQTPPKSCLVCAAC